MDFPKSTEFNKRIPKQKFYENLSVTPELKQLFVQQISMIFWRNKIAPSTVNIEAGKEVVEIEIFHLKLNQRNLDLKVLQLIDEGIPYHILFLIEYDGLYQAYIGYKETNNIKLNTFKIYNYYHTDWLSLDQLNLRIEGLNTDSVYANFIRQIAGEYLSIKTSENIKDAIIRDEEQKKLLNQIRKVEAKINKEPQFNRQVKLNEELKKLKKELKGLQ